MPAFPANRHSKLFWSGVALAALALPAAAHEPTQMTPAQRARLEAIVAKHQAQAESHEQAVAQRAAELGIPLRVELENGGVQLLVGFTYTGRPIYETTTNLNAARTTSTDDVWAGGSAGLALDGTGILMGIWDGGSVRTTHQEFGGRAVNNEAVANSQHSTHVAGTMIASGVNVNARGMASNANLTGWDFNNDEPEIAAAQLLPNPPIVSNHSYGFVTGWRQGSFGLCPGDPQWHWFGDISVSTAEDLVFGLYEDTSAEWDDIIFNSPNYLPAKAAGNDRGEGPAAGTAHCHFDGTLGGGAGGFVNSSDVHPVDGGGAGGFDTIGGGASMGKNVLTVGAVNDIPGGYTAPADVVMSSFSGWGPTDDGRIKPDIVGNGVGLTSTNSSADTTYVSISGTSMATPNVTGSLGALRHHAANLGVTLNGAGVKAVALHGADEAGANPGPDYTFGWGLLNSVRSAAVITRQAATGEQIYYGTIADGGSYTVDLWAQSPAAPIRATLVWVDPAGAAQGFTVLDPPTPNLVNDLDMVLVGPATHNPWVLNPASPATAASTGDNDRDNVEQIDVAAPTAGAHYALTITEEGTITDGPQAFVLVVSGNVDAGLFDDGFETGDSSAWDNTVP
jgi:hypothetical protein